MQKTRKFNLFYFSKETNILRHGKTNFPNYENMGNKIVKRIKESILLKTPISKINENRLMNLTR